MAEMTHSSEHHCQSQLIAGFNHFRITLASARLNDGADSSFFKKINIISEGKEGIRSEHSP